MVKVSFYKSEIFNIICLKTKGRDTYINRNNGGCGLDRESNNHPISGRFMKEL